MNQADLPILLDRLRSSFDIESSKVMTMEDLIAYLSHQIEWMLDHERDLLMSLLYRHDVAEANILEVLDKRTDETMAMGLARLIVERQVQRIRTRKANPPKDWWS